MLILLDFKPLSVKSCFELSFEFRFGMSKSASEMIKCRQCGIPWSVKRLAAHVRSCSGGITGFQPVKIQKRYLYQCIDCFSNVRKENIPQHKKVCRGKTEENGDKKV